MSLTSIKGSRLGQLARKIEGDIRARGLRPGDRYHSCADVGSFLGVSAATAHRAMNLLVQGKVLTREHGRGTFIGNAIQPMSTVSVRTVYILIEEQQRDLTSVPLDLLVAAVRTELPQTNVQFSFISSRSSLEFLRQLVEVAQLAGQFAGAIAISCSREVYQFLSDTGEPVVVLGSLYADQWHLPSVDLDYQQSGYLMGEYLASRGHRKIALLATGGGRPGDNALYDGVTDAITIAGLPPNSLLMRIFPQDFEAFRSQIREMLQRDDRPTGILCASDQLVGAVAVTAQEIGIRIPQDLELVFESQSTPSETLSKYPYVKPRLSFYEIATTVARMLNQVMTRVPLDNKRVIVPVELHSDSKLAKTSRTGQ